MPTSQNMESDRPAPTWNPIRKQSRILNVTDKGKVTVFRSGSRRSAESFWCRITGGTAKAAAACSCRPPAPISPVRSAVGTIIGSTGRKDNFPSVVGPLWSLAQGSRPPGEATASGLPSWSFSPLAPSTPQERLLPCIAHRAESKRLTVLRPHPPLSSDRAQTLTAGFRDEDIQGKEKKGRRVWAIRPKAISLNQDLCDVYCSLSSSLKFTTKLMTTSGGGRGREGEIPLSRRQFYFTHPKQLQIVLNILSLFLSKS